MDSATFKNLYWTTRHGAHLTQLLLTASGAAKIYRSTSAMGNRTNYNNAS
jgi:hypothetical protein